MAMACLRLVTFLPLLPLFRVPRFFLCIARSTSFEADLEYLRAMAASLLELWFQRFTCGSVRRLRVSFGRSSRFMRFAKRMTEPGRRLVEAFGLGLWGLRGGKVPQCGPELAIGVVEELLCGVEVTAVEQQNGKLYAAICTR